MAEYARAERRALTELMADLGPDAPTLCEGWTTRDLAAHLVLRERRPDAAAGILVRPLRSYTARVQRHLSGLVWTALLDSVRSGPPALLRPLDGQVNVVEMYVHHEDVRRAQPDARPRALDHGEEAVLWARSRALARLVRRRLPVGVTLVAPGFGQVEVRRGDPHVTVSGPPGEIILYLTGRQRAAQVEVSGPPDAVARLAAAPLGL